MSQFNSKVQLRTFFAVVPITPCTVVVTGDLATIGLKRFELTNFSEL